MELKPYCSCTVNTAKSRTAVIGRLTSRTNAPRSTANPPRISVRIVAHGHEVRHRYMQGLQDGGKRVRAFEKLGEAVLHEADSHNELATEWEPKERTGIPAGAENDVTSST